MKNKLEVSLKDLNISEKEFKKISEISTSKKIPLLNKILSRTIILLTIATWAIFIKEFPEGIIKDLFLFVVGVIMLGLANFLSTLVNKCKLLVFKEKVSNFVLNQIMTDLSQLQKEIQAVKNSPDSEC